MKGNFAAMTARKIMIQRQTHKKMNPVADRNGGQLSFYQNHNSARSLTKEAISYRLLNTALSMNLKMSLNTSTTANTSCPASTYIQVEFITVSCKTHSSLVVAPFCDVS
ncbi:uncharacterized protein PHALS_03602 [Plasmopara halstedii]|uniref:Uncharacterized protein n=1 Tax=Plasmopara halstedii TaxID=4781 RepID=A0A0P1B0C9_PLAHL|nr:uncharacterized protein PHALS_03602 [Plasmopara halstedii]CEG46933.1 hypothetical protein PHALS_03602 [Plasmopara halstedii]|eukprot:XP_024583302.1 hypothetical protein PHALS_03602 [Plasmopara halstedii]